MDGRGSGMGDGGGIFTALHCKLVLDEKEAVQLCAWKMSVKLWVECNCRKNLKKILDKMTVTKTFFPLHTEFVLFFSFSLHITHHTPSLDDNNMIKEWFGSYTRDWPKERTIMGK